MDPERFKHTALDDDSDFYKKPEKKTEKQKWHDMNHQQRRQYFRDYYLKTVVILAIAAVLVIAVMAAVFNPKQKTILDVAVLEEDLDDEMAAACQKDLQEIFEKEGYVGSVVLDDNYPEGNSNATVKLTVYIQAGTLDAVIAPEEKFKELASYGTFVNLEDVFTKEELKELGPRLRTFETGGTQTEPAASGESTCGTDAETEKAACGIDLSGSKKYQYLQPAAKKPILGIVVNSKHQDLGREFAKYLLQLKDPEEETGN